MRIRAVRELRDMAIRIGFRLDNRGYDIAAHAAWALAARLGRTLDRMRGWS